MKRYFQTIIGLPKKKGKINVPIRRVEHAKPLTPFQRKVQLFRQRVLEHTNGEGINSSKLTEKERLRIRKEALEYASF